MTELVRALAKFAVLVKFDSSLYVSSEAVDAGLVRWIHKQGVPPQLELTELGQAAKDLIKE